MESQIEQAIRAFVIRILEDEKILRRQERNENKIAQAMIDDIQEYLSELSGYRILVNQSQKWPNFCALSEGKEYRTFLRIFRYNYNQNNEIMFRCREEGTYPSGTERWTTQYPIDRLKSPEMKNEITNAILATLTETPKPSTNSPNGRHQIPMESGKPTASNKSKAKYSRPAA